MADKKGLSFDGSGFSKDEFSEDDRAKMRQRQIHYDQNFKTVDEILNETGLRPLVDMLRGVKAFVATTASVVAIVAAIAIWQGWLNV